MILIKNQELVRRGAQFYRNSKLTYDYPDKVSNDLPFGQVYGGSFFTKLYRKFLKPAFQKVIKPGFQLAKRLGLFKVLTQKAEQIVGRKLEEKGAPQFVQDITKTGFRELEKRASPGGRAKTVSFRQPAHTQVIKPFNIASGNGVRSNLKSIVYPENPRRFKQTKAKAKRG